MQIAGYILFILTVLDAILINSTNSVTRYLLVTNLPTACAQSQEALANDDRHTHIHFRQRIASQGSQAVAGEVGQSS